MVHSVGKPIITQPLSGFHRERGGGGGGGGVALGFSPPQEKFLLPRF